jgi:hypothetical protein
VRCQIMNQVRESLSPAGRLFFASLKMCEHGFEIQARFRAKIEMGKTSWRSLLWLVVTIITGGHYFGRNVTKPVWLAWFIL